GRRFIIDEDAAVFYFRRIVDQYIFFDEDLRLFFYRHIGPPVPGRNAQLPRQFHHPKSSAPPVTAGYDDGVCWLLSIADGLNSIRLPFVLQITGADLFLF